MPLPALLLPLLARAAPMLARAAPAAARGVAAEGVAAEGAAAEGAAGSTSLRTATQVGSQFVNQRQQNTQLTQQQVQSSVGDTGNVSAGYGEFG